MSASDEQSTKAGPIRSIFYTDNCESAEYQDAAVEVARNLGLRPLTYRGATLSTRDSNLDPEIRDDFFSSSVAVVVIGKGAGWRASGDLWVLPEIGRGGDRARRTLVYCLYPLTEADKANLEIGEETAIRMVGHASDFRVKVKRDLKTVLGPSS